MPVIEAAAAAADPTGGAFSMMAAHRDKECR
jgi:hypothetical protein